MSDVVRVSYVDGEAEVQTEGRALRVSRRDDGSRVASCPVELVSVALGS